MYWIVNCVPSSAITKLIFRLPHIISTATQTKSTFLSWSVYTYVQKGGFVNSIGGRLIVASLSVFVCSLMNQFRNTRWTSINLCTNYSQNKHLECSDNFQNKTLKLYHITLISPWFCENVMRKQLGWIFGTFRCILSHWCGCRINFFGIKHSLQLPLFAAWWLSRATCCGVCHSLNNIRMRT